MDGVKRMSMKLHCELDVHPESQMRRTRDLTRHLGRCIEGRMEVGLSCSHLMLLVCFEGPAGH